MTTLARRAASSLSPRAATSSAAAASCWASSRRASRRAATSRVATPGVDGLPPGRVHLRAAVASTSRCRAVSVSSWRVLCGELADVLGRCGPQRLGVVGIEGRGREEGLEGHLHAALAGLELLVGGLAHGDERGLGAVVELGAEDLLQETLAVLGLGPEEARELALRQHDRLDELGAVEADGPLDLEPDLVEAGRAELARRRRARPAPRLRRRRRSAGARA